MLISLRPSTYVMGSNVNLGSFGVTGARGVANGGGRGADCPPTPKIGKESKNREGEKGGKERKKRERKRKEKREGRRERKRKGKGKEKGKKKERKGKEKRRKGKREEKGKRKRGKKGKRKERKCWTGYVRERKREGERGGSYLRKLKVAISTNLLTVYVLKFTLYIRNVIFLSDMPKIL